MPYTASTLTLASAQAKVAAASGSEGNTAMETLAARAVQDALQRWSAFRNWNYLKKTTASIAVTGAISRSGTITAASGTITVAGEDLSSTLAAGDVLVGSSSTYIPPRVLYVKSVTFGTNSDIVVTLDPAGASGSTYTFPSGANGITVTVTFGRPTISLPSAARTIYSVRMAGTGRILRPAEQRNFDRDVPADAVDSPWGYSLYEADTATGKLSLVPVPASDDFAVVRYLREPAIASASGNVLDVPRDAERCIIALAKGYYLMDKGEEKATFWLGEGEKALIELRGRDKQDDDGSESFVREGSLYPVTPFTEDP